MKRFSIGILAVLLTLFVTSVCIAEDTNNWYQYTEINLDKPLDMNNPFYNAEYVPEPTAMEKANSFLFDTPYPMDFLDKAGTLLYLKGHIIDMFQTTYVYRHPDLFEENHFIMRNVGRDGVMPMFVASGTIFTWAVNKSPPIFKKLLLVGANIYKWRTVIDNRNKGIRIGLFGTF